MKGFSQRVVRLRTYERRKPIRPGERPEEVLILRDLKRLLLPRLRRDFLKRIALFPFVAVSGQGTLAVRKQLVLLPECVEPPIFAGRRSEWWG